MATDCAAALPRASPQCEGHQRTTQMGNGRARASARPTAGRREVGRADLPLSGRVAVDRRARAQRRRDDRRAGARRARRGHVLAGGGTRHAGQDDQPLRRARQLPHRILPGWRRYHRSDPAGHPQARGARPRWDWAGVATFHGHHATAASAGTLRLEPGTCAALGRRQRRSGRPIAHFAAHFTAGATK